MKATIEATETETEFETSPTAECDEENPATCPSMATIDLKGGERPLEAKTCDVESTEADDSDDCEDGPIDGVGCREGCARDRHVTLTILSVSLLLVPILFGAKALTKTTFLVLESILGALYLFFVLRSNTFQYLLNINTSETVMDYMNQMYRTEPVVKWFIQCYHFEQKSREVDTPGPNGTTIKKTEYYQELVLTHSAHGQLVIARWTDISTPLDQSEVEAYNMTKISVKKSWVGDAGADEQKRNFISANHRDVFYDFSETLELAEYRSRFLGFTDLDNVPPLAHWGWYLASHLTVVLAVPYRMWLSSKSHKVRTTIVKQVWTQ